MLREKDLWIGDNIRLIKSNRIGKYAGKTRKGKLRVQLSDKVILTTLQNIVVLEDELVEEDLIIEEENENSFTTTSSSVLDLHMKILAPEMKFSDPARILTFQLDKCREFLENAKQQGLKSFHIIHGKGKGILKSEVLSLLKSDDDVNFTFSISDGGAVEVWLR